MSYLPGGDIRAAGEGEAAEQQDVDRAMATTIAPDDGGSCRVVVWFAPCAANGFVPASTFLFFIFHSNFSSLFALYAIDATTTECVTTVGGVTGSGKRPSRPREASDFSQDEDVLYVVFGESYHWCLVVNMALVVTCRL